MAAAPSRAADPDVASLMARHLKATVADRRWLHEHPELSGREHETQRYLAAQVAAMDGPTAVPGDWGLGLVYVLEGQGPGPTVLWRADMDALPLTEDTGLPFASTVIDTLAGGRVTGVMHACGHDIHMSVALGAMRVLADLRPHWPGRLVFVFQPAEETGAGAKALIEAGVLEGDLRPDRVFAFHDHPTLLVGQAGVKPGPATANVDGFRLTVHGTGGHGAYPYRTVDPVTLACRMVLAVNDLVAREVDPNHPVVISFGKIQGGTKANVIPDRVELAATVRTRDAATRALIEQKLARTIGGLAAAAGAPEPDFEFYRGTPAGYNDPVLSRQLMDVFRRVLGPENTIDYPAGMGGEDFGRFSSVIPGVQFRLGVGRPDREMSLHAPDFDPDERAVEVGMRVVSEILLDQLRR
jgi:hippurate hydrolase